MRHRARRTVKHEKALRSWQLQEAKNSLSEVVQCTLTKGPQVITRHGKPSVVVISVESYERLKGREVPLVDFLLGGLQGTNLDLEREKYPVNEIEL